METFKGRQRDRPLPVAARRSPRPSARTVVHDREATLRVQLQDEEVLRLAAKLDSASLGGLDLDEPTVRRERIVTLRRVPQQLQPEHARGECLTDGPNHVPVRRELPALGLEHSLQLAHESVDLLDDAGRFIQRFLHVNCGHHGCRHHLAPPWASSATVGRASRNPGAAVGTSSTIPASTAPVAARALELYEHGVAVDAGPASVEHLARRRARHYRTGTVHAAATKLDAPDLPDVEDAGPGPDLLDVPDLLDGHDVTTGTTYSTRATWATGTAGST